MAMKFEISTLTAHRALQALQASEAPIESEREQLERKLKELTDSIRETKNAISLAEGLKNKSWFSLVGGNLTGKTQKELAQIVEDLAEGLKFTQTALELVMQLQNRKHLVLKDFHAAVVTKIENIHKDTTTLNGNQREATIYILSELRDNIAEQIRYRELVDEHEDKFDQVSDFIEEKLAGDAAHEGEHDALELRFNTIVEEVGNLRETHAHRFLEIQSAIDSVQSTVSAHHQMMTDIDILYKKNIASLTTLETLFQKQFRTKAAIGRQILPVIALLLSMAAIILHFVHW